MPLKSPAQENQVSLQEVLFVWIDIVKKAKGILVFQDNIWQRKKLPYNQGGVK